MKDYYRILGISTDATAEDIKNAFRRLAHEYHPDHNPENRREAEEKFKQINEAHQVLSDDEARWRYDSLLRLSGYASPADRAETASTAGGPESMFEILQRLVRSGVIVNGMDRGDFWGGGCGCRQGRRCRGRDIGE
jgi:DnaJ-class molecular chaperone